jgi:hypothetical protein
MLIDLNFVTLHLRSGKCELWEHLAFNLESSVSFHALISLLGWAEMKFSAGTLTTRMRRVFVAND